MYTISSQDLNQSSNQIKCHLTVHMNIDIKYKYALQPCLIKDYKSHTHVKFKIKKILNKKS